MHCSSGGFRLPARRLLCLAVGLLIVWLVLLQPGSAQAHPLGNFSVNRYSRLDVYPDALQVRYVLDMAEVPTFQERATIDTDGDGTISPAETTRYGRSQIAQIQRNLHLMLNGAPVALELVTHELTMVPGQGNLPTLRLAATFRAPLASSAPQTELHYRDANDPTRPGWQEIIAVAQPGIELRAASVPDTDLTNELRDYPDDLLQSPLLVREATVTFAAAPSATSGSTDPPPAAMASAPLSNRPNADADATAAFAALIAETAHTPSALALALLAAFGLGAVHAFSPGHGKTLVAAYLVGSRGTAGHALFLGLTTTITHTIGVFALGLVTLVLAEYMLPEQLYPILSLLSGIVVLVLGLALLRARWQAVRQPTPHPHTHTHADHHTHHHAHEHGHTHHHHHDHGHTHHHDHEHGHDHEHTHTHLGGLIAHRHALPDPRDGTSWRGLLALGISGGLLPCPSALIVLLSAIALGRVGFGLLLILAFSLGLASVLTAIGVALVHARHLVAVLPGRGLSLRLLPLAGSVVVVIVGSGILLQSLIQLGLVPL